MRRVARAVIWTVGIVLFILWAPALGVFWLFNQAVEHWRWTLAVVVVLAVLGWLGVGT